MKITHNYKIVFIILFTLMATCYTLNVAAKNITTQKTDSMSTGKYADVNGIKMYYEIHGEGKTLVLIHGGGSTIETNWARILPLLANKYKVIAVELQAHGHTSDRDAPVTFMQDADDVAALLIQLNINKASFFGFSNGGSTTMQIAIRHPKIVDKIIVASAVYLREGMMPGFFDMMQNASLETMPQPLKDAFMKINNDTVALRTMHDKDRDRMIAFKDWNDSDLQNIKAPALIINGDKDVVTTEHAVKISKLIPNAVLLILPGVHGAYLGEECTAVPGSKLPEMTVGIIEEFLDR